MIRWHWLDLFAVLAIAALIVGALVVSGVD